MFNKDRFHNQLALNLGYRRIVNDKRINISIDDKQYSDDMIVSICIEGFSTPICYKASEELNQKDMDSLEDECYEDIKVVADAVQQAYIQASKPF